MMAFNKNSGSILEMEASYSLIDNMPIQTLIDFWPDAKILIKHLEKQAFIDSGVDLTKLHPLEIADFKQSLKLTSKQIRSALHCRLLNHGF